MADPYGRNALSSRAIYPTRFLPYIGVLLLAKLLRSVGIFVSFDLLKDFHIVHFLFIIKVGSALCLLFLQKPFGSGKRLTKHQWFRVGRHALFGSLIQLQWLFGLTLCGPLRTLFLFEHSDIAVIAGLGALFSGTGGPSKFRGAVFFLLAMMALILFDNDDVINQHHENHIHSGVFSHLLEHMTNMTGWSDHMGGVILLVVGLLFKCGYNSAAKRLSVDVGGAKRLNALSALCSVVLLLPWAVVVHYTQDNEANMVHNQLGFTTTVAFSLVILLVFVLDFYVEAVCINRMEHFRTACYGSMATFASALFISWFWAHPIMTQVLDIELEEHMISGGVIFCFVMLLFATHILTSPNRSNKGTLVGHTASGLPLYNFTEDVLQQASHTVMVALKNGLRQILEESDSRKIFYFLCINICFTFVEFAYGAWTNSLGLISDGFHMLFDCSALVMGLYAAVMARWKATRMFPYGYDRVEILSGFINGLFLIVIAFFVFTTAVGRIFDPPEISTDRLLVVSVAGFLVNLVGIFAFSHGHSHGAGAAMATPTQPPPTDTVTMATRTVAMATRPTDTPVEVPLSLPAMATHMLQHNTIQTCKASTYTSLPTRWEASASSYPLYSLKTLAGRLPTPFAHSSYPYSSLLASFPSSKRLA